MPIILSFMTYIYRKLSSENLTAVEKELSIFNHLKKSLGYVENKSKLMVKMNTRKLTPNFSPAWSSSGFLLSSGLETTGKRSKSTISQLIGEITELEKQHFTIFLVKWLVVQWMSILCYWTTRSSTWCWIKSLFSVWVLIYRSINNHNKKLWFTSNKRPDLALSGFVSTS